MNKQLGIPFYESTINVHPLPIWILKSDDNTFYSVNSKSEIEFLYSEEELLGKNISELCPSFSQVELNTFASGGKPHEVFTTIRRKDGLEIPAELYISSISDGEDSFYYIIVSPLMMSGSDHDVNNLTKGFYLHMFKKNLVPMIIADMETMKILQVNDGAIRLYGYSHDEFVNMHFNNLYHSSEAEYPYRIFHSIREDRYNRFECNHVTKHNKDVDVEMYLQPFKSIEGTIFFILILDVTEKRLAFKLLEESLNNYKLIASNSTDLIIRQRTDGKINYASPVSLKLLGYKPSFLIAENIYNFMHPDDMARIRYGIQNMIETAHYKTRFRIRNFQGKYLWFESTAKIIPGEEIPGEKEIISVSRDITDRVEIEKKLKEADKKSDEIEKLKHIILSNLSHELRTPLQSILGYSEIIKDKLMDADMQEDLNNIYDNGKRLLRMINLFLNLSYLEANNFLPHFESFDINEIVKSVADTFQNSINQKNLYMKTNFTEEPLMVSTDRILFRDILDNLIDNSVKFTETGGVHITTSVRNSKQAVIEIKDTGIGIPKGKEDLLFQEFRQLSEGLSRKYEGIGLGLTISKRLVDRINGSLSLESIEGQGTIVRIYFQHQNYS